jgi:hypothetical protein
MDKREFIHSALGLIATAAIAPACDAPALAPRVDSGKASPRISAVVYDERYGDSRQFATALGQRGAAQFASNQEPVDLWYAVLRAHALQPGARIAGLSCYSDLELLRSCARESQLRLVYRGMHDCRTTGRLTHTVWADRGLDELVRHLGRCARAWSVALAAGLNQIETRTPLYKRVLATNVIATADYPGTLASWLMARV